MTNPKLRFVQYEFEQWKPKRLNELSFYAKDRVKDLVDIYVGIEELLANGAGVKVRHCDTNTGIEFLPDDLLLGNIRPYLKKLWQADCRGSCSADVLVVRAKDSVVPKFLKCVLSSDKFFEHIAQGYKGSKMPRGDKSQIMQFALGIPEKEEQQKIADFFTTLDDKIALAERKLAALQTLKSGLLQKILSREIRFKREDSSAYPEWKKGTLLQIVDGLQYGMNSAAIPFDGKHKYLRITDIDEATNRFCEGNVVSPQKEVEDKYRLREGDILFARTGNSVGKTYLYDKKDGEVYFAGFLIRGHVVNGCNPYFIFLQTLSQRYKKWVSTTSMRSGQPGINAEEYGSFEVDLPCLEEQTHIATLFKGIDEKIFCSREKLKQLRQQKQAFLQQMFV